MPKLTLLDPTKTGRQAEDLENQLRHLVVGQDAAIHQIVRVYQTHVAGLSPAGRPIGNFLFLGPTGSGKTRVVEATAECLLKNPRGAIKIDCAEFQHSHEIAKLIGSPPGYLGHRETHPLLSQEALNQYHTEKVKISLVLFDEIEKASDAVWNLLLGILDKATLTLGDNRRVDFSRTIVFMTSNLGASEMSKLASGSIGFAPDPTAEYAQEMDRKIHRVAIDAAKRKFSPEFMNRIDKTVVFRSLDGEQLRHILDLELGQVQGRIMATQLERPFAFYCTPNGEEFLLREGTDLKYGARHLKRAIERFLVFPLSSLISTGQIEAGDQIRVDVAPSGTALVFFKDDNKTTSPSNRGPRKSSNDSEHDSMHATATFRTAVR